ncbi:uncharacterized protein C8Q71DRAFT_524407 [Rhodofomes roseus]|nr:uncharacterized protein C8Q71DRAFT_524407 [Rhodofomes roseus]KAH9838347.1 hypothetical protein C8Q71DRAFT_524407 [Rhodofomes roseus]
MARDCQVNRDPNAIHNAPPSNSMAVTKGGFDSEYASLMAELGEGGKGPGDGPKNSWMGSAGHDITAGGSNIPPWRRPEVWQSSAVPPQQNNGYRPPQGYGGYGAGYGAPQGQQWGAQGGYGGGQAGGYYPQQDYSANYAQYYQGQYAQQQTGTPSH